MISATLPTALAEPAPPSEPGRLRVMYSGAWPIRALVGIFSLALGIKCWNAFCHFVQIPWNDVRLRPIFLVRDGLPLYPGLDSGIISTWMYGPAHPLLMWPITLAPSYQAALMTGAVLTQLMVLLPVLIVCLAWPTPAGQTWPLRKRLLAAVLVGLAMPYNYLNHATADDACVGFGLLSLLALARSQGGKNHPLWLWGSAMAAAACAFSKLHGGFLLLGQLVWLGRALSWTESGKHALRLTVVTMIWLLICQLLSASTMAFWQHQIALPGSLPWSSRPWMEIWSDRMGWLFGALVFPGVISIWLIKTRPLSVISLPAWVFALSLPFCVVSMHKFGADVNSLHPWLYLTPLLLPLLAATTATGTASARKFLPIIIVLVTPLIVAWPHLRRGASPAPRHVKQTEALSFATQHPDETWLPWRPLATYFATGRHDHDEDGIMVRIITGHTIGAEHLNAGVPPNWRLTIMETQALNWRLTPLLRPVAHQETSGRWQVLHHPAARPIETPGPESAPQQPDEQRLLGKPEPASPDLQNISNLTRSDAEARAS